MVSVDDLIKLGYTTEKNISDIGYCPPVGTFLSSFSKENYTLTVTGRSDEQLFPLSSISESRIISEPTLVFDSSNIGMDAYTTKKYNGFTYTNLEGPWSVTISNQSTEGHFSASVDSENSRISIMSNVTDTDFEYTCTVTLSGTRTDGLGTYSASFKVIQYARVTEYELYISHFLTSYTDISFQINNTVQENNSNISFNQGINITLDVGETITIVNIDQTEYKDAYFKVVGIYNSKTTEICSKCIDEVTINYDEIEKIYPDQKGLRIDINIVDL